MRTKIMVVGIIALAAILAWQIQVNSRPASVSSVVSTEVPLVTPIGQLAVPAASYDVVRSLKEKVATSTVIVLGEIRRKGEVVNLARDINDFQKPAPDMFGIGQVYHFQVKRYLKGQGPDILNVVQLEGIINTPSSSVTQADIEREQNSPVRIGDAPFQLGIQYLLLLTPLDEVNTKNNYLTANSYPWRFILTTDGNITPEAPKEVVQNIGPDFAPASAEVFLSKVSQVIQAEKGTSPKPNTP